MNTIQRFQFWTRTLPETNARGEAICEKDFTCMLSFLGSLKNDDLEPNIISWGKRNIRHFLIWENKIVGCTGYRLRTTYSIPSRSLFIRALHNYIGHGDLGNAKQFILELFCCPHRKKGYIQNLESFQCLKMSYEDPKISGSPSPPHSVGIRYVVDLFCRNIHK